MHWEGEYKPLKARQNEEEKWGTDCYDRNKEERVQVKSKPVEDSDLELSIPVSKFEVDEFVTKLPTITVTGPVSKL